MNSQSDEQNRDKAFKTQLTTVYHYLREHTATASMIEATTGIEQKNICRYKRTLEKHGRLKQVRFDYCKVTMFPAWYLTTAPAKFLIDSQLKIF